MGKNNNIIKSSISKVLNIFFKKIFRLKWWFKYPILIIVFCLFCFYLILTGFFGKALEEKVSNIVFSNKEKPKKLANEKLIKYDSIFNIEQNNITYLDSINDEKIKENDNGKSKLELNNNTKIKIIDDNVISYLSVFLEFKVNGEQGHLGMECKSFDKIELSLEANEYPIYFLLVSIDSKGIQGLNSGMLSVSKLSHNTKFIYFLDENLGFEIIYSIVSYNKFSYSDIEKHIVSAHHSVKKMKGGFTPFTLKLPKQYKQSNVYFNHKKS